MGPHTIRNFQFFKMAPMKAMKGGAKRWQVCLAGGVHGQDSHEARDQGGQEGGVRQGGYGKGETGQDRGEGLPGVRVEEAVLTLDSVGSPPTIWDHLSCGPPRGELTEHPAL